MACYCFLVGQTDERWIVPVPGMVLTGTYDVFNQGVQYTVSQSLSIPMFNVQYLSQLTNTYHLSAYVSRMGPVYGSRTCTKTFQ
jgi:hypothetical protein